MAKSEVEKVTEEKVSKGGFLVKLYFDMQHTEKEKLQPLMVDLINEQLMKEKGVVYCYGAIEEPLEKDGIFITSAMVTVLFDKFMPLINVAFNYSPAGIEILQPQHDITFKTFELQSILMDLSQISLDYSKYVLERVMKPEDIAKISEQLNRRTEMAKKFLDENKDKKD
ncbi:MAG: hypothetical protein ABR981_04110 [Candidatus Micrarchaeaceae archaeon]|jgi:hypothetical protein